MSFLKSFFGAAAANAMRDSKIEEQKRQERAALYDELEEIEEEFSLFLEQSNTEGIYIKDVRLLDEGRSATRLGIRYFLRKKLSYLSIRVMRQKLPSRRTWEFFVYIDTLPMVLQYHLQDKYFVLYRKLTVSLKLFSNILGTL